MSSKFTTTVQQYNDTQDLYIEIPHYILQNLNWEEGDELAWSIKANQIILTKVKDAGSTKEEPTMSDYDWYTVKAAYICLLYTSPSPRDATLSRMPSSA